MDTIKLLFTFTICSQSWSMSLSSSVRVHMAERCTVDSLFSYIFEEALHLFFILLLLLAHFLSHFFQVFIGNLLSMAIQHLCYTFSCNFVQTHLLHQPTNDFNSVLHWLKSCEVMHKILEKMGPHSIRIVHRHFTLTISMKVWQRGLLLTPVHWLKKRCGVSWHVNITDVQKCSALKVFKMARGTVQEKQSLGC